MLSSIEDILPVLLENIPAALCELDHWVAWKPEPSADNPEVLDKVPYDCLFTSSHASHSAPSTWRSFADATRAYADRDQNGVGGIMIALGDGLAGIDLDNAIDPATGQPTPEAQRIIDRFSSYSERSVSGTGIRIFVRASEGPGRKFGGIEVYSRTRFLTVTGHRIPGTRDTVEDRGDEFVRFREELEHQRAASRPTTRSQGDALSAVTEIAQGVSVLGVLDDEILMQASEVLGERFDDLWAGDTSAYDGDDSSADMALACFLAFMCGPGEHERVERLMRMSALARPKWDRPDYLPELTIPRAFDGCADYYDWGSSWTFGRPVAQGVATSEPVATCEDDAQVSVGGPVQAAVRVLQPRPTITIGVEVDAILTELERVLAPVMFQRAGKLVEIVDPQWRREEPNRQGCRREKVIAAASVEQVQRLMSRHAAFVTRCRNEDDSSDTSKEETEVATEGKGKKKKRGWKLKKVPAPKNLAKLLTDCGQWEKIPKLNGLMHSPYMGPSGAIVCTPGYDPGSGYCLLDSATPRAPVPTEPSSQEVARAVTMLMELIAEFPIEGDESRSAWLAALLTVVARPAIDGPVPMFWLDANRRGTGKSKLGRLISIIACGVNPTELSWTADEQEMEKRIASLLFSGCNFAMFDNAAGTIRNPILERFLTSSTFDFRRFHRQELVKLPNRATLAINGNNLALRGDLPRRVVRCRLVTTMECPEGRTGFRHADIEAYATAHQPELLAAALTIVRAHAVAGFAPCTVRTVSESGVVEERAARPAASYGQWDTCVRHAILRAGLPDPMVTQDQVRDDDEEESKLKEFLTVTHAFRGITEWTVNDLLIRVFGADPRENPPYDARAVADAIRELTDTPPGKMPEPKTLGYRLKDSKDKPLGGFCLRKLSRGRAGVRYTIEREEVPGQPAE